MRNWNRRTELATRVAALIPSETGADPFAAFWLESAHDIVNGLVATGVSPNLVHMKRYIEGGADNLLLNTLRHHFIEPCWTEDSLDSFAKKHSDEYWKPISKFTSRPPFTKRSRRIWMA